VAREGDGFAVTIDGSVRRVDVARIDAQTLSLLLDRVRPEDTARSYEVVLTAPAVKKPDAVSAGNGAWMVRVNGTEIAVAVNGRRRWGRHDENAASSGPQRIEAPMPGKIVRVLVAVGETVEARQPVVVVEAMKMENELRAARGGTVAEIHAREGALVEAGSLLVVIQ
jgi:biotin carboxyl carrier protein